MKYLIFLLLALLLAGSTLVAQKKYIVPNKTYSQAKINQTGKSPLEVKNLVLLNDTLLQYSSGSDGQNTLYRISASSIRSISVKQGTRAGWWAIYGGSLGLVSSLTTLLQMRSDPYMGSLDIAWGPILLGFTGGGILVGALVGAFIPNWNNLYIPGKTGSISLRLTPGIGKDYYGMGLALKF